MISSCSDLPPKKNKKSYWQLIDDQDSFFCNCQQKAGFCSSFCYRLVFGVERILGQLICCCRPCKTQGSCSWSRSKQARNFDGYWWVLEPGDEEDGRVGLGISPLLGNDPRDVEQGHQRPRGFVEHVPRVHIFPRIAAAKICSF